MEKWKMETKKNKKTLKKEPRLQQDKNGRSEKS